MAPPVGCPDALDTSLRHTQDSIVKVWRCKFVRFPTTTPSPVPSNRKAFPTLPGTNEAFPWRAPWLPPVRSVAFPSADHALTTLFGGGTQVGTHLPCVPAR